MSIPLAALLAACEVEPSPKDSPGVDSPVEDTAADTADTGETGDSGDSEDTADSADTGDSGGETAELDTCDPSASVHRDTGADTAPILDYLAPVDTGTMEFLDTGNQGDCETSPTDAFGHPRLACADMVVDFEFRLYAEYIDAEAEWLGDLDGDGADEVVVTVLGDDGVSISTWLRYGETASADAGDVEPSAFADAWSAATDDRVIFRGGDFNGDGLADLLTEAPYGELGVLLSDGGRYVGEVTEWPETGSWATPASNGYLAGHRVQGSRLRSTWAADVDGDGQDDLVASHTYDYPTPTGGVAVLVGEAGFGASGALYDQATWRFFDDTMCSESRYCNPVIGVPVGDLDGDGSAELLVSSGYPGDTHYVVSPVDLPRCSLPVIDAAWASLVDEDADYAGTGFFTVPGPADFDGDGHADLALTTTVGADPDGLVTWIARGGETRFPWSRDVRTLPDRVEFARVPYESGAWDRLPFDVAVSDPDGDGRDDLVVGGRSGDTRGRIELVRAPSGVVDAEETNDAWVMNFDTERSRVFPGYGRGDLGADGTEDLLVLFNDYTLHVALIVGEADLSAR